MKVVIFGLSISSSWGNGHATLWRGLCSALARRGHRVIFFERDVAYYAAHRDLKALPGVELVLYPDWASVAPLARRHLAEADVGVVTSYCADGVLAGEAVVSAPVFRVFYDLDTPVTLARLEVGHQVEYIGERGLADFDLALSYTGGAALEGLQQRLGAPRVATLFGSVDPYLHRPVRTAPELRSDLSYLGTFAHDRQQALEHLFVEPARQRPDLLFRIAGAQYPPEFPWAANMYFNEHLAPETHAAFYCSSRLTLSVTRREFAKLGYGPSARLFEAASCGVPVISDWWEGLGQFFEPGREILVARSSEDVLNALDADPAELARIGKDARLRVMCEHTAEHRAQEFEMLMETPRAASFGVCVGS